MNSGLGGQGATGPLGGGSAGEGGTQSQGTGGNSSVTESGDSGIGGSSGTGGGGGSSGTGGAGGGSSVAGSCIGNGAPASPSTPGTLIDFDMSGRNTGEVLEPGWNEWIVSTSASDTKTFNGVTFKLEKSGSAGSGLTPVWNKAGVDAPNYARLVGDGITVADGDSGGAIQFTISGLSAGTHTLLAYHNAVGTNSLAPVNVTVNGTTQVSNVQPTSRALTTDGSASSYVTFDVTAGKSVTVLYAPSSSGSGTKNVILNAIALDVPNPVAQAKNASPQDRDWHVDADSGSVTLSFAAAKSATAHNLYFGTDATAVLNATTSSPLFRGKQSQTSYKVSGLTNLRYYYWRVDEIDAQGNVTKGKLWSFSPRHLAFSTAEGYGRLAHGGRCGKVVHVTNLNDSGPFSLRAAVENDIGPRTIVFDVGGTFTLKSRLTLSSNFTTVAGQTAPGKGILVRGAPFGASGVSDSVMRFVRVRVGYIDGQTYDGTGLQGSEHSIFDHISVGWSEDEAFSSRNAKNITLQRTLISETLNNANHTNSSGQVAAEHGYAGTISGNVGSYHHILSAHNQGRNFSMGAAIDGAGNFISRLDLFNNVVYNFGGRANDGQAHLVNFVNNYYKKGAATTIDFTFSMDFENYGTGTLQAFYKGNILQKTDGTFTCNGTKDTCGRRYTLTNGNPEPTWNVFPTDGPFFPSYATIQSATVAYKDVLSDVGTNMPVLDDHDQRMIKETLAGTYTYKGSITGKPGLIDRETDSGGYESFPTTTRAADFDTDGDGLPDWYEAYVGTDPKSPKDDFSDSNADPDGDGYTNLEDYLEWMATPHVEVSVGSSATVDLAALFRGVTKAPSYKAGSSSCLTTSIKTSTLTVTPKSTCKIVTLPVTVTDGDGSTLTRSIRVFVRGSVTN